jgi:hypothetical protein
MKLTILMATVAAIFIVSQPAQAREHRGHHYSRNATWRHVARQQWEEPQEPTWGSFTYSALAAYHGGLDGRPDTRNATRRHVARQQPQEPTWGSFTYSAPAAYRGGLGGRPAAWCGWEMRQLVSSDPGPEYNLARNWARWGHAGPAGVGAVVVWPHHVGKIVGQEGDQWLVESGNDGHAVRTRVRSIGGAIAIRWG